MDTASTPRVWFALPGSWVDVPLRDRDRVEAMAVIAAEVSDRGDAAATVTEYVRGMVSDGDVEFMMRIATDNPAVLLLGWLNPSDASERAAAGNSIGRADGYVAQRFDLPTAGDGSTAAEYVVSHPAGGVRCRLRVVVRGHGDTSVRLAPYDLLAETVTWKSSGKD